MRSRSGSSAAGSVDFCAWRLLHASAASAASLDDGGIGWQLAASEQASAWGPASRPTLWPASSGGSSSSAAAGRRSGPLRSSPRRCCVRDAVLRREPAARRALCRSSSQARKDATPSCAGSTSASACTIGAVAASICMAGVGQTRRRRSSSAARSGPSSISRRQHRRPPPAHVIGAPSRDRSGSPLKLGIGKARRSGRAECRHRQRLRSAPPLAGGDGVRRFAPAGAPASHGLSRLQLPRRRPRRRTDCRCRGGPPPAPVSSPSSLSFTPAHRNAKKGRLTHAARRHRRR